MTYKFLETIFSEDEKTTEISPPPSTEEAILYDNKNLFDKVLSR